MKEEWKKIFLQLLAPFLVAMIVLLFMYGYFVAGMKKDAVSRNEQNMIAVAEKYGMRLEQKFKEVYTEGKIVARLISSCNTKAEMEEILSTVVNESEFSVAMVGYSNGNAYTYRGEMISLSEYGYYSECRNVNNYELFFIENMGFSPEQAFLLVMAIPGSEDKLMLFYPTKSVRSLIKVNQEFDQASFAALMDESGNVLEATEVDSEFLKNENFWEGLNEEYTRDINKAKQNIENEKSGCLYLQANSEERAIVYTPLASGGWSLLLGVNERYVMIAQKQFYNRACTGMNQVLIVVFLTMLVVAVINILGQARGIKSSNQLKEKADTDLLTGLDNKLATERKIKEYMESYPDTLAMMFVLDIDNFKKINDTMGHAFGDEVLRELGRQIGINFRVTDIIGRTGGDEFTIFLKNLKDDSNTLREAQKLTYFFKHFQVGDYVKYSATASIGAAVFPADGSDFDTLYKSADAALYKAKKRGKNQLAFFDDRDRK